MKKTSPEKKNSKKDNLIRLNKYLANTGIESRRKCDEFIKEGLVKVNGQIVTDMGVRIDPARDRVTVNKQKVKRVKSGYKTLMLYKPRGYVSTHSKSEGKSVYDLLPSMKERLVLIGRLDKESEGLLLFSNDGDLVYRLTHPSFSHEKIYNVMVEGQINQQVLKSLNKSMIIDDYKIKPAKVKFVRAGQKPGRTLLNFTLTEGRKRQIRKMCELHELKVCRLTRVQVRKIQLKGLKPGQWKYLTDDEVVMLKSSRPDSL